MQYLKKYRILLVDDSKSFLDAMEFKLRELVNNQILFLQMAQNGLEAIEIVKSEIFDIIFMDIEMPVMDGIQATKHISSLFPKIKIIAMSSHGEFDYLEEMIYAGSLNYLVKSELNDEKIIEIFQT